MAGIRGIAQQEGTQAGCQEHDGQGRAAPHQGPKRSPQNLERRNRHQTMIECHTSAYHIISYTLSLPHSCLIIISSIIIMSTHKLRPKAQQQPTSLLPVIAKKLNIKTEKTQEKLPTTDRYQKFIKDQETNFKRDLQKLRLYQMQAKNMKKSMKYTELTEEDLLQSKKAKSTPKLAMGSNKRSFRETKERYMHNQRLSMHFNLPKENNQSIDSSDDQVHRALLKEQQQKMAEPAIYVLSKNAQYNLIREKSKGEERVLVSNDGNQSQLSIKEHHQSFPMIPNLPQKQPQIHSPPKQQKYIKEKFVGQQAISKFYNRYKNIQKVRELQHFKLQFNPLTMILTILEHYNIPPKRMQVIKLKGEEAILDLKNCGLGSGLSIKAVAQIIEKVKVFQEIDLSYNNIHADLCDLIIPNLSRMRRINLSYNKIGRRGMDILSKMVYNQQAEEDCELQELNIESNYINDTAIGSIFTHFANINSLVILNISKNYLGNYTAARLKEFLVADNTLAELYLHWAELGTKATKLIFQGLAKNNALKVLDISWNQIGLEGIRPFCNFLINNTSLVHLDISFCEIDEIDTRKIAKVLKNNHTIYGLHYQGNLGFIDFKGYLHSIKKEDRYIPISIRTGLVQRISSINIIKDSHAHASYDSMYYKSICWICEGWEEKYFKVAKGDGQKACFIHFDFQAYNGVPMSDKGSHYELLRMCPLKPIHYFITKAVGNNQFIHTYIPHQSTQVKLLEFNSTISEFHIQHKKFHEIPLKMLNMTPKPQYYSQIFNEDYITKIHCIPRSDQLISNPNLFVSIPVIRQEKGKTPAKAKKERKKKQKKKEPELIKEIEVKDIPQDFDPLFNKNVGDGEQYQLFLKKCVEFDVSHSKMTKVVKNQKELNQLKHILQKNYDLFQKIYYYLANNNPNIGGVYSIPQHRFQKFIEELSFESKRVTKAKIRLKLISCLTGLQGAQGEIQGFYRPQFFEFLVRVAMEKWCQSIQKKQNQTEQQRKKRQKYPLSLPDAFSRMLKVLKKYEEKADPLPWRLQNWNSYEVNVVLKSYTPVFERIYEKYAGMTQKNMNTKAKKRMLLEEFKILCLNAELRKTREALKDLDVHYRTSKKLQIQDGISDTGLDFLEFLQTFARFAQGLYLKPIGSQSDPMWQKQLILLQQIPLFLKIQKLLKQIYRHNPDLKTKKFDLLLENGLFPQQVSVLMTYFKDKYEGGKDMLRKTVMMKHLKINSLEGQKSNRITLKFLIDLLKIKAAQIQEQNRMKMMQIQEEDQHHDQEEND